MRVGAVVGTTVILAAAACRDGASVPSNTAIDSAGVRIVTTGVRGVDHVVQWSVSPTPVVNIGSEDRGEISLFRVTSVTPLPEGRVAVGATSPPAVQIFREDGTYVGAIGRAGSGPGEFSTVQSVVELGGDSLAVWDQNRRRISIFSEDGEYQREVALDSQVMPSLEMGGGSTEVSGWSYLLPSTPGFVHVFAVGFFGPGTGAHRSEALSFRFNMDGRELARFGPFPGAESYAGGQVGFLPLPFGKRSYAATVGDMMIVGTAEDAEVRVYGGDGSLLRIVRWPDQERSVAGSLVTQWEDWLDEQLSALPEGQRRDMYAAFDALPYPEEFPAYAGIVGTDDGTFWVGEYPGQLGLIGLPSEVPAPPARHWLVFDINGQLQATVETPHGFDPHVVSEGRVWGVYKDELLVESVRAYDLERD